MASFGKYDVLMKVLEIIEAESRTSALGQERLEIINIIFGGINMGDTFENINNSIIATRASIAMGIERLPAARSEIADALGKLEKAIHEASISEMSEDSKLEAFQLLGKLTDEASSKSPVRTIIKAVGNALWEAIKNVDSISKTASYVWPVIQRLWM